MLPSTSGRIDGHTHCLRGADRELEATAACQLLCQGVPQSPENR